MIGAKLLEILSIDPKTSADKETLEKTQLKMLPWNIDA